MAAIRNKSKTGSKARKPARKAASASSHKLHDKPAGTVHAFPGRAETAKTMENFMAQSKTHYNRMKDDAASVQKGHVEAMMQSGGIAMRGMETLFKTCIEMAQGAAEKNAQAVKTLIGCRTLSELAEAHNRMAQQSFDDMMAGATKISELTVKTATDAFEPINDHLTRAMTKASKAAQAA